MTYRYIKRKFWDKCELPAQISTATLTTTEPEWIPISDSPALLPAGLEGAAFPSLTFTPDGSGLNHEMGLAHVL